MIEVQVAMALVVAGRTDGRIGGCRVGSHGGGQGRIRGAGKEIVT